MCGIDHYGPEKPVGNHFGTGLRKAVTYHCQPSPKAQESGTFTEICESGFLWQQPENYPVYQGRAGKSRSLQTADPKCHYTLELSLSFQKDYG